MTKTRNGIKTNYNNSAPPKVSIKRFNSLLKGNYCFSTKVTINDITNEITNEIINEITHEIIN